MMLDKSATRFYNFLRQTLRPLGQQRQQQGLSNRFEASLLHLYSTVEMMCSAFFDEDSVVADPEWSQTMCTIASYVPLTVVEKTGVFDSILARLLRLKKQSGEWLHEIRLAPMEILQAPIGGGLESEPFNKYPSTENAPQSNKELGRRFVLEAWNLRQACQEATPFLWTRNKDQPKPNTLYYHCSMILISRLFIDPLWALLDIDLPVLPQQSVKEHALEALRFAEWWLPTAKFGAVFAVPGLTAISLELNALEQRQRVRRLFQLIADKGFAVASVAESDVALAWSAVPCRF
ncbi:hypothetical protein L228DRAFT_178307 [Xylona heveae TC161]|uniref:Transcription factor domain-containing protein n=1 Tax=Xylona heveae (strain CBS 132557 / TC161) TaxID=1328760 RepID=A0A165F9M8_XYLHT|nr:hypothetical protein L228DRAFT_178307 [Xylona heveae TC161]KZF20741.1 hypothetical protein L228DRAFT_178307 [Xylona heveae TC161]